MKRRTFKSNQRRRQTRSSHRKVTDRSRVYFRVVLATSLEQGFSSQYFLK